MLKASSLSYGSREKRNSILSRPTQQTFHITNVPLLGAGKTPVADEVADVGVLHVAVVVLVVGPGAGERNALVLAPFQQGVVDELAHGLCPEAGTGGSL